MQNAVDVVMHSEHATSKVAACIFNDGALPYAAVSHRPAAMRPHFAWDARIGRSSQFIHAELAAMAGFEGVLQGAHICITDPFCPNCAKLLAEAGIRNIYIDHKGFQKDFITRNAGEFQNMSMNIAAKSGMNVYVVNRKADTVEPIMQQALETRPALSAYEMFEVEGGMTLEGAMQAVRARLGTSEAWVLAFLRGVDGARRGILMFEALPPGITPDDFLSRTGPDAVIDTGKYRYPTDPLIRLLIASRRLGMHIEGARVASAKIPSSRALVNAVGFGLQDILLASDIADHDETAPPALEALRMRGILKVSFDKESE